jgi:HAD superfamily hydrolase (TIGR01450 family)
VTVTGASEGADVLAARYDTALVDLDGVVYVGPRAVPGAPAALAAARDRGMRVAFVTNNASRTPEAVATHLRELGVQAEARDVVTSAQAAATLLADRLPAGAAVLVVGGEGLHAALAERGLRGVRSADDQPQAVVQGFAPEVDWRQLAEGALAVSRGLPWIASNVDLTIPTDRGIAPGNGTLVAAVAAATGASPLVAGKPELPLHREAMRRTGARRALVVGDRLDTDIEGANRAGVDSLLVLTGVTSPAELVTAPPALRPTYVAADLCRGLLRPLPAVRRADDQWFCGGWALSDDGAGTAAPGAGDRVDGLRALCALAWERGAPADVEAVLGALGW